MNLFTNMTAVGILQTKITDVNLWASNFFCNKLYYRMRREPIYDEKGGTYQVSIIRCEKLGYPVADKFELVGSYKNIYDLLENCTINNKKFKDVIIDDKTQILSKD